MFNFPWEKNNLGLKIMTPVLSKGIINATAVRMCCLCAVLTICATPSLMLCIQCTCKP